MPEITVLLSFKCQTYGLAFDSTIFWQPEEFVVDSVTTRYEGPVAAKQVQIIILPSLCLTADEAFVLIRRVWLSQPWDDLAGRKTGNCFLVSFICNYLSSWNDGIQNHLEMEF